MAQLRILVVDDDKDVCAYLADFLSHDGYWVKTITDPMLVMDELKRGEYHVVVLDLMMPGMSGMDLL